MKKYKVVKTLIIGNQSPKEVKTKTLGTKTVYEKRAMGYVIEDIETGEKEAMTVLESVIIAFDNDLVNAEIKNTKKRNGELSPYIIAYNNGVHFQDKSMVVDARFYLKENEDIKVTEELEKELFRRRSPNGIRKERNRTKKPKYSKEELLESVQRKKLNQTSK